jgi:hypothetical protein
VGEELAPGGARSLNPVCAAEKLICITARIAENRGNSVVLAFKSHWRKCLVEPKGNFSGAFLCRARAQSDFPDSVRRMQCDHKPIMQRKSLDFPPVCGALKGRILVIVQNSDLVFFQRTILRLEFFARGN